MDSDYRGIVKVIIQNHGQDDFKVCKGDRIAQLILEQYASPPIKEVESLEDTGQEDRGFGSTGVTEQDLLIRFINEHRMGPMQVPPYLAKDNDLYGPEK